MYVYFNLPVKYARCYGLVPLQTLLALKLPSLAYQHVRDGAIKKYTNKYKIINNEKTNNSVDKRD